MQKAGRHVASVDKKIKSKSKTNCLGVRVQKQKGFSEIIEADIKRKQKKFKSAICAILLKRFMI